MTDFPLGKPLPGLDETLGIVYDAAGADEVRGSLEVNPRHLQPAGLVHGGVYAAIAESAASYGTYVALAAERKLPLGLSNSTSFLRPVSSGSIAIAAQPRHKGRTTWIWDVEMSDDEGNLCAIARVTVAVRDAPAPS